MAYITRAQSGLPGPTDGFFVHPSEKSRFVVHWDGGRNPEDAADEIRLLEAYAQHHFNQGWQGPAYNLAVGPITGNVYEYRGLSTVGTHAPGANRNGIGVILIGGEGNLTEAGKRGLREAYALACSFAGRELTQEVHSDVVATACPGNTVRNWVHGGGLVGGSVPDTPSGGGQGEPEARFPAAERYGTDWVRALQQDLITMGHDLGEWGADGKDGDRTREVMRYEQGMAAKNGYGVIDVDGIGGPDTRDYIDWWFFRTNRCPMFPLPQGWYFGPEDGPEESVSGLHGNSLNVARYQRQMHRRGCNIAVDGEYADESERITELFQEEKGLTPDGLAGVLTWVQAWLSEVTPAP